MHLRVRHVIAIQTLSQRCCSMSQPHYKEHNDVTWSPHLQKWYSSNKQLWCLTLESIIPLLTAPYSRTAAVRHLNASWRLMATLAWFFCCCIHYVIHGLVNANQKADLYLCICSLVRGKIRQKSQLPPISGRSFLSYSFSKLLSISVASVSWDLGASIWFTVTSS